MHGVADTMLDAANMMHGAANTKNIFFFIFLNLENGLFQTHPPTNTQYSTQTAAFFTPLSASKLQFL